MIANIRYCKTFTVDFLQKKMKVNEGEVPQYYVENSHAAIIDPVEWERVQLELSRRKKSNRRTYCSSPFAGKLICGDCGEIYGSKVWHSNSKYRRTIWQCNGKFRGEDKCQTPHLYEEDLKAHFVTALSTLLSDREALMDDLRTVRTELLNVSAIENDMKEALQEQDIIAELIKKLVAENATQAVPQTDYIAKYNSLAEKFESLQARHNALQHHKERRLMQADAISGSLFALGELDLLDIKYNDTLWSTVIDHVTVYADERLVFRFKIGYDIMVEM